MTNLEKILEEFGELLKDLDIIPHAELFDFLDKVHNQAHEAGRQEGIKGCKEMTDVAEMLWVVLANVSEGYWTKQTKEWQEAARRWRDNYFKALSSLKDKSK